MKHALAHAMRRTARALIRQSNKLEPPHVDVALNHAGAATGRAFAAQLRVDKAERDLARAQSAQRDVNR